MRIIITGMWKVLADRTGEPRTVAYAQRLVTLTDWIFTLGNVILILIGAYGMVWTGGLNPLGNAMAHRGPEPVHRLGHHLGRDPDPDSDQASAGCPRLCRQQLDPRQLLASQPTLDRLGHRRHAPALGQSLFHGGEAGLKPHKNQMRVTAANSGNRIAPDHTM